MNSIISLCHFCDKHGPTIIYTTQTYKNHGQKNDEKCRNKKWRYGLIENLPANDYPQTCVACLSVPNNDIAFTSNDDDRKVSYVSSQFPLIMKNYSDLKLACVRALSCEVCPDKEGVFYFGDKIRGNVICFPFYMNDFNARGKTRFFTIIVFMRDEMYLLNSWNFFVTYISKIIKMLQTAADTVYTEQEENYNLSAKTMDTDSKPKPYRPLSGLVGYDSIWKVLHFHFSWVLMAADQQMIETIYYGQPLETKTASEEAYTLLKECVQRTSYDDFKNILSTLYTGNLFIIDIFPHISVGQNDLWSSFKLLVPNILKRNITLNYADEVTHKPVEMQSYIKNNILFYKFETAMLIKEIMQHGRKGKLDIKVKTNLKVREYVHPQIVDEVMKILAQSDFSCFARNISIVLDDWKQKARLWAIARMAKTVSSDKKKSKEFSEYVDYYMAQDLPTVANEDVSAGFSNYERRLSTFDAKKYDVPLLSKWAELYEFSKITTKPTE